MHAVLGHALSQKVEPAVIHWLSSSSTYLSRAGKHLPVAPLLGAEE